MKSVTRNLRRAALLLLLSPVAFAESASAPAKKAAPPKATPIEDLPARPALSSAVVEKLQKLPAIFDGRTLTGWAQVPPAATRIEREDIVAAPALATRLHGKADAVSAFLAEKLDEPGRAAVAAILAGNTDPRQTLSPLARSLNAIAKAPLYDEARFQSVALRPKTRELLAAQPSSGYPLARLNRLLLEDAFDRELAKSADAAWVVKNGVMASTGAGRGTIFTEKDYESYRVVFQVRQSSGNHVPGVLIFCQRPPAGEFGLDALGAVQFQVPNGGHWDYRPGFNRGGEHFTRPARIRFNLQEWAQCEIVVNGKKGTARMAVAQPVGTRGIEVLRFDDPNAARSGPIALQMHNAGLFDEFRDIRIEENPSEPEKLLLLEQ